jgi:UDP-N-acetylglucosamine--N-acetylmuramyl-(pentapeptide) pyrophosphoryl-undecaprenol N-acetylglucosamine transferase
MEKNKKKIILSGGGTAGPVVPLIFINKKLKDDYDILFVGTRGGLEKNITETEGIRYTSISSGKLRRYFSWKNFTDIFKIFLAFWQSLFLIIKEKPNLVVSAGGFVAVPLSFAAYILRVPVIIHQQDVLPGLANKLMAPFAKIVTVTFKKSVKVYGKKARLIGNIGVEIDDKISERDSVFNDYNFNKDKELLVILGGGTGSFFINNLVFESLDQLSRSFNIVHITGRKDRSSKTIKDIKDYHQFDFVNHDKLIDFFQASDIIVSRCGLSTLTEISFLKKASILIPIPNSHQEDNAFEFERNDAAIVLNEKELNSIKFVKSVMEISKNRELKDSLIKNSSRVIKNGNQEMIAIIKNVLEE